ncbi:MAG: ABC-2 family transporter protein [Acidimicrobiales bacterium]
MRAVRLALLHLRVGVMNELQYRANFVVQLLQSLVAVATGLVVLSLIFDRTDQLDGWTRPQLLVVMGVFTLVGGVVGFVIEPNMGRVMMDIRQGTFDHVLTKPVDSQLLSSIREFRLWRLTDALVGVVVLGWGIADLDTSVRAVDVLGFVLTLAAGTILVYCLWLAVTTGAFWFVRMEQVQELFTGLYRAGAYPVTVYPTWLRLTLTYLVPIGFAITVPSESLTGRLTWERGIVTVVFLAVAFGLTRLLWKAGSRRYAGASS